MKLLRVKLLILVFFMCSALIQSQVTIQGVVTDISDNPVSGALVEIINEQDTLQVNSSYTGNNGSYSITLSPTGMNGNSDIIPKNHIVLRNYPNPFNPSTIIYFEIPIASVVEISIFDILGRKIKTLPTKFYHAGYGQAIWDATNNQGIPTSAGIYFCRLKTDQQSQVHKMILLDGGNSINIKNISNRKISTANKALLETNTFLFKLRISGSSISQLELDHLSCQNDTIINVQVGNKSSNTIGNDGGFVSMTNGFNLQFQEGAFEENVEVTVSEVPISSMPDSILSDVIKISPVISINTGGNTPNNSAIVSFTITPEYQQHADSTLAIYRWDGTEWSYAGGYIVDNTINTYVRDFSLFVSGYESTDSKIYRLFRFENSGPNNAMVYVKSYQLLHPQWDYPITEDYGTPCFTPTYEPPIYGNRGWYPQGFYQFCADWRDDTYGDRHIIIGGDPPNWSYYLHELTALDVPPMIYVNTSIAGSSAGKCPCEINNVTLNTLHIIGYWYGEMQLFGYMTIYITEKKWIIYQDNDITKFPVILLNENEKYVILWDYDDARELARPYIKFTWENISETQIKITIYDTKYSVSSAINDNEPELSGIFTKTTGL